MAGRVTLLAGVDFIKNNGLIEVTQAGFARMVEEHVRGNDVIIEVDGTPVLCIPGTANGPPTVPAISIECPICGLEMKLLTVEESGDKTVFDYKCANGHRQHLISKVKDLP